MGRKQSVGRGGDSALGVERDVVILGGGPAGSAAGIALARAGFRVALLAPARPDVDKTGETLPPQAKGLLERLGVWNAFQAAGHRLSPGVVTVWGQAEPRGTDFGFSPGGPGWHLDCARFDGMLADAAALAGARVFRGAPADSCERGPDGRWRVTGEQAGRPVELQASWLIDATGRCARLAHQQGAERRPDDRLVAVIARDCVWNSADPGTLLEARPSGWWRASPTPDGRALACFMTDSDLLPYSREALLSHWNDELQHTSLTRESVECPGESVALQIVAANGSRLSRCFGAGWLAVGDAAATHDPLSSQGILQALKSGVRAAEALTHLRAGDAAALDRFAERAEADFQKYRRANASHYALEQRWTDSIFWKRRHRFTNANLSYGWDVLDAARPAPSKSTKNISTRASG